MNLTYRYRVKSLGGFLNGQARAVNFVWNHCNEQQKRAVAWGRRWLTAYDLQRLCSGSGEELGLLSSTIDKVCQRYAESRSQHKRPWLRFRGKKSLGWIPLKCDRAKMDGGTFVVGGKRFRLFYSRPIQAGARIAEGSSFAQDARGNWFLNLALELPEAPQREPHAAVGIDLGLKDFAALSTGEKIANPRHYAEGEAALASAQRAGKKRQARNIHARIQNRRRDGLHKLSHRIVRDFDLIAVGNVNAAGLAKTSMAKSVHDASWSAFRAMLAYKSIGNGARYAEVNEAFSTQVCSACGCLPPSRPKGIADLGIREWTCSDCGTIHDRDVNAARNILHLGHQVLAEGVRAGTRRDMPKRQERSRP